MVELMDVEYDTSAGSPRQGDRRGRRVGLHGEVEVHVVQRSRSMRCAMPSGQPVEPRVPGRKEMKLDPGLTSLGAEVRPHPRHPEAGRHERPGQAVRHSGIARSVLARQDAYVQTFPRAGWCRMAVKCRRFVHPA